MCDLDIVRLVWVQPARRTGGRDPVRWLLRFWCNSPCAQELRFAVQILQADFTFHQ
jgi:hypothetical protein